MRDCLERWRDWDQRWKQISPADTAAALIYAASRPDLPTPDFCGNAETAMAAAADACATEQGATRHDPPRHPPPPRRLSLERVRHLMQALITAARDAAVPLDPATAQDTIEALDTIAVDNGGWLRELNASVDRDEQRVRDDEADAADWDRDGCQSRNDYNRKVMA